MSLLFTPMSDTIHLPIQNQSEPCLVDRRHGRWFEGKTLFLDTDGVFFLEDAVKRYVHDQVMIVGTKEGHSFGGSRPSRNELNAFVRNKGCRAVRLIGIREERKQGAEDSDWKQPGVG